MTEKRSQLFIKKQFQTSMVMEMLMITFIMINILVVTGFLLLDYVPNLHQKKEYIAAAVIAFEVIGFFLVYRHQVRSSHRIAGPLFSLERNLKSIESGDISFSMDIRESDQFRELSDQMNNTVDSLRAHIENIQTLASTVQQQPGNRQAANDLVIALDHFKINDLHDIDSHREVA